jgi:hypothetical protein
MPFVPEDFDPPTELRIRRPAPDGSGPVVARLVPLGPEHNDSDLAAWTSSIAHIRATPGFPDGRWPPEDGMSPDANRSDLERHAADFAARRGFTYTVLRPEADEVIGCLYVYPITGDGGDGNGGPGEHDADVRSWVRADHAELDAVVYRAVSHWLAERWPFRNPEYAARPE